MAEPDQQSLQALQTVTEKMARGDNHYGILGVGMDADVGEIRNAFFQLAKLLHPDLPAFAEPARKAQVTKAFQAISAANSWLSDPGRRREYDQSIGNAGPGVAAASNEPNPDLARIYMHRSKQILQQKGYAQAEDGLRAAKELFGDKVDAECDVLLAWAVFNNTDQPEQARAAEAKALLEGVLSVESGDHVEAQAAYYMAIWCKLQGEIPQVKKYLGRCLKISPRHVDAQRELRLFERRRQSSSGHVREKRRTTGEKRRTSRNAIPKAATNTSGERVVKKVPLSAKKKKSFLDWLLGK